MIKKMWLISKSVIENKLLFLYGAEPVFLLDDLYKLVNLARESKKEFAFISPDSRAFYIKARSVSLWP